MRRLIYLVRHAAHDEVGRVLSGRSEIALNAAGRAEAAALAAHLSSLSIDAVFSSPRRRAVETAAIVAPGRAPVIEAALDEIDFGDWTGQRFDALPRDPRWHAWNAHRATATVPGGETMHAAAARALDFVRCIDAQAAMCVSHCDVIRGVVALAIGLSLDRLLDFDCDPASVTTLAIEGDHVRLVTLNERPNPLLRSS
ncbi:histidine phosphatase family protein [Sphingomonas sp. Y38-1Y]|uniref:histidine phosphatase family protein n=1 Tax=Sphingomonas sp. Y38-1Y TaxID=3078265 RepID=UPI0028ED0C3B|nr:histidine phosphatase family protein [Sphingomonas sp. Y38-1Y]